MYVYYIQVFAHNPYAPSPPNQSDLKQLMRRMNYYSFCTWYWLLACIAQNDTQMPKIIVQSNASISAFLLSLQMKKN